MRVVRGVKGSMSKLTNAGTKKLSKLAGGGMKRSRCELLELAKRSNIGKCEKLKKSKIVELLFTDSAVHIQRMSRKRARYRPVNTIDPITQRKLVRRPFLLISEGGVVTGFDAKTLRKCIEVTHSAVNPITQETISVVELHRLAKVTGGKKIKIDPVQKEKDELQMHLSLAYEREIGDLVQGVLDDFEHDEYAEIDVIYEIIPDLIAQITAYSEYDQEGCRHVLDHCIEKIKGSQTNHDHELTFLVTMLSHMKKDLGV